MARTPKNYAGTVPTSKHIGQLLPALMQRLGGIYKERPDLVLAAWPQVIGEKLAPMTKAVAFEGGVLIVKVKNSTLLSLLSQHEKPKLLRSFKEKFPQVVIRDIIFRIG